MTSVGRAIRWVADPAASRHRWTCFNVPGLGVHCMPPSQALGTDAEITMLYFDTTNVNYWSGDLLGTEQLLRATGRYHGTPCPQEGVATWHLVAGGTY